MKDIRRRTRRQFSAGGKNHIVLVNYFLPGDLETRLEAFVEHYNNQRSHESLDNVTPAKACSAEPKPSSTDKTRPILQTIKPQSVTIVLTTDTIRARL